MTFIVLASDHRAAFGRCDQCGSPRTVFADGADHTMTLGVCCAAVHSHGPDLPHETPTRDPKIIGLPDAA